MKLRYTLPLIAAALTVSAAAEAATGYTTDRVTLRAGPGRDFPRIDSMNRNVRVQVHGCIDRYDWCDISRGRERGWVSGRDLVIPYQGRRARVADYGPRMRLPVIQFSFDNYWNAHYRGSSFYRDRDNWRGRWGSGFRDQDRDGIPNGVDRDQDGDRIPDRRDRDRDNDGRPNNRDSAPNNPNRR